jgi:hypothetical protein
MPRFPGLTAAVNVLVVVEATIRLSVFRFRHYCFEHLVMKSCLVDEDGVVLEFACPGLVRASLTTVS